MAMSSEPRIEAYEENNISIKLTGDLQKVQIAEEDLEETDSDDDDEASTCNSIGANTLSTLPNQDPLKYSPPTFGSVQVADSEYVHFGDKITGDNIVFNFKGPVVIKQVVHPKEQDNPGYEQTEDDAPGNNNRPEKTNTGVETKIKPSNIKLWLKLSFSAVCIVIVGGICAIVSLTLMYTGHENTNTGSSEEQDGSTGCVMVEGFPNYGRMKLLMIPIFLVVLIFIGCVKLLTMSSGDNTAISVQANPLVLKKKNGYNVKVDPLLIAPTHLRIVPRTEWLAQPVVKSLDRLRLPAPWVIIQHTATESCYSQSECILSVRLIQMFHVESRGWYDIGYNFLVAGDGSAYYGRGWENEGAHTLGYNRFSVGIAFIGTFNNEPPPKKQLDACKKLILKGVQMGKIAKDYKLFAHRQLTSTLSPGDKLFDILKEWPHFVQNDTDIESLLPEY